MNWDKVAYGEEVATAGRVPFAVALAVAIVVCIGIMIYAFVKTNPNRSDR